MMKASFHSHIQQRGVALVITLILLSIITFMTVAFLVISRHASEAVTTVTQQNIANQAAQDAAQKAEARIVATMVTPPNNGFNFGPVVSQNYQSPAFTNGVANPANVNYASCVDSGGNSIPYTASAYLQMLNNLLVLPRPPVFISTNPAFPLDFRYYLDLNRNGIFDPATTNLNINGTTGPIQPLPMLNQFGATEFSSAGDPEWIGVLEHPDQPHSRSNLFVARYAFFAQPIGNSLDINFIHNQVKQELKLNDPTQDGFLRNQGVGSWEINLAGFLNGLNPNVWIYGNGFPIANPNYVGLDTNTPFSILPPATYVVSHGSAFQDAASILQYRYNPGGLIPQGGYLNLVSFRFLYGPALSTWLPNYNSIDFYAGGPLMNTETVPLLNQFPFPSQPLNFKVNWSGAGNLEPMFTSQDFFNPNNSPLLGTFPGNLVKATVNPPFSFPDTNFSRYTYYRMLSQMGMDSAPEPATKLNVNYINIGGYDASNLVPWYDRPIEFPLGSGRVTNSALVFFTNAANRLLGTETNFIIPSAVAPFTPTNLSTAYIPIYPVSFYTPSVHRMLQLAANIYDAANPKPDIGASNYFDYPSVFRPIFGAQFIGTTPNIYIRGYVEVTNTNTATADYNLNVYSLLVSNDLRTVAGLSTLRNGGTTFNIYGVPWIIGAKKGLPNFNQISLESFTALTRKLQIIKPFPAADRLANPWQTNVQYVLSVSNALFAEAWNSYALAYPRAVDIGCSDTLNMTLTNENGVIAPTTFFATNLVTNVTLSTVPAGAWTGIGVNLSSNSGIPGSFRFPLLTTVNFLPGDIYSTKSVNTGTFVYVPNAIAAGFEKTTGYPLPRLGLNLTNRFRMVMVDDRTGRVIDYVSFDGMGGQRDLTGNAEMSGHDDWGPGGIWDTNRMIPGSGSLNVSIAGIENQITASQQPPPFPIPGYDNPVSDADWNKAVVQALGFNSVADAATAFNSFFNGNNGTNAMQVPFTPTRSVCVYYTWQANDPLVHYTMPDLTDLVDSSNGVVTNWTFTNLILGNLGQINKRYNPWGGSINGGNQDYNKNMALMDPLMTSSDAWQFPNTNFPNIGWLGRVHRGTPWQTVYMKPPSQDPNFPVLWQKWTGNAGFFPGGNFTNDSTITQPVHDWSLFDLFTAAPNDNATRGQLSINQPNFADWAALLDGVIVLSNDPVSGLVPAVIDPNDTNASVYTIFNNIQLTRSLRPGGVFTRLGDILATPALTTSSPYIDPSDPKGFLNDEAYERLPQQIMSLLRVGQPRYVIYAYGQSLKPADRSVVSGGPFYGTCTNYQITGEVVTRTVVRFEPETPPSPTDPYTPFNPTGNPVMPFGVVENYDVVPNVPTVPAPRQPIRAVIESFTTLPPE